METKIEDKLVTNAEVMSILNKKIKRNIDLTPFEYYVYRQHENQTASPLYRKRRLLKLAEYLKQYNFTPHLRLFLFLGQFRVFILIRNKRSIEGCAYLCVLME